MAAGVTQRVGGLVRAVTHTAVTHHPVPVTYMLILVCQDHFGS